MEVPDNIEKVGNLITEECEHMLDPFQMVCVTYKPKFLPPNKADKLFEKFIDLDFVHAHTTRSVLWFGPKSYTYGSTTLQRFLPTCKRLTNTEPS